MALLYLIMTFGACKSEKTSQKEPIADHISVDKSIDHARAKKSMEEQELAQGFKELRRLYKLNSTTPEGYKEEYFNNPKANTLRDFTKNSLLDYEKVTTYDLNGGTTFNEKWQFCADGTFYYVNSSLMSIMPKGGGMMGSLNSDNSISGLWDVIAQNNIDILILYSEHQEIKQINPNGFFPMHIKNYQNDVVRIASNSEDKLYSRQVIQCN